MKAIKKSHRKFVKMLLCAASLPSTLAVFGGNGHKGRNFDFDYCSIGNSLEVYEDSANYFTEVFYGYDIPIDPTMCPFHPSNLAYLRDTKSLSSWKTSKVTSSGHV